MKKLTYTVILEFEDNINADEEIMEVGQNIANAIVHDVKTCGIVPEASETFTKSVTVKPQFIDSEITEKL